MDEYTALEYKDEPSYKASIILGNHLMQHMGELDNNWIRMYVIDQEVPKILQSLRRPIKSLVNNHKVAGYKTVHWDATNNGGKQVPAGMYIYTIQAGEFRQTRKMVLLK